MCLCAFVPSSGVAIRWLQKTAQEIPFDAPCSTFSRWHRAYPHWHRAAFRRCLLRSKLSLCWRNPCHDSQLLPSFIILLCKRSRSTRGTVVGRPWAHWVIILQMSRNIGKLHAQKPPSLISRPYFSWPGSKGNFDSALWQWGNILKAAMHLQT